MRLISLPSRIYHTFDFYVLRKVVFRGALLRRSLYTFQTSNRLSNHRSCRQVLVAIFLLKKKKPRQHLYESVGQPQTYVPRKFFECLCLDVDGHPKGFLCCPRCRRTFYCSCHLQGVGVRSNSRRPSQEVHTLYGTNM